MHLSQLRLRDFRNYPRLDAAFGPGFHLFLGRNAQGKTNLLEAIYLLATLRSFRGVTSSQMIRHGQKGYFVGGEVVSVTHREIKWYWSARERKLSLDGQPIRRLTDFVGVFRAVVFCSEDVQLVKGPGSRRRRFLDLLLAQTQPGYLATLQRYTAALKARNALLKQRTPDAAALESFGHELVRSGEELMRSRQALIPRLAPIVASAHRKMASAKEQLTLAYEPAVEGDFGQALKRSEARERALRTTVAGPHRDELQLLIDGQPAAHFASEGQKRTLAIALKMAQAEFITTLVGTAPVLLIDDIMGELDLHRRTGFMPLLQRTQASQSQVFMTCTEENWPSEMSRELNRWNVEGGGLRRA